VKVKKFKDTALYSVINHPREVWCMTNAYTFILLAPYFAFWIGLGIPMALVFDFFNAIGIAFNT